MPPLHPLVIHFPIALFVISLLLDGISAFTRKNTYHEASRLILVLSWIGTGVALITGDWLKDERSAFLPHGLITWHEGLAVVFAVVLTILVVFRVRKHWRPSGLYLFMASIGFLLLAAVGHTGGSMAWPSMTNQDAQAAPSTSIAVANSATDNTTDVSGDSHTQIAANNSTAPTSNQTSSAKPPATNSSVGKTSTVTSSGSHGSVASKPTTPSKPKPPALNEALYTEGAHFFTGDCQSCHSLGTSEQYFGVFTASQWDETVSRMQNYSGGQITNTQAQAIEYYLIHHHN